MGIWDRFQRSKNHHDSIAPIKIGDWVTQYSAGYWMVVKIFPKYAEEDYSFNGISWKKGEHIKSLKDRFSIGEFWAWSADYQQYIVDSSKATHILYFLFYPWEIDDNFQPLHCGVSLKKL